MAKISLPLVALSTDPETWDSLIRQFAVEEQHDGSFLATGFLEMTVHHDEGAHEMPLTDALDFIRFSSRRRFAEALQEKYRIGTEFSSDPDADHVFNKVFVSAEATAMGTLGSEEYSVKMLVLIEIYYWVTLQLLRMDRGEYMDRKSRGNQARLGDSLDLAGEHYEALAAHLLRD